MLTRLEQERPNNVCRVPLNAVGEAIPQLMRNDIPAADATTIVVIGPIERHHAIANATFARFPRYTARPVTQETCDTAKDGAKGGIPLTKSIVAVMNLNHHGRS